VLIYTQLPVYQNTKSDTNPQLFIQCGEVVLVLEMSWYFLHTKTIEIGRIRLYKYTSGVTCLDTAILLV